MHPIQGPGERPDPRRWLAFGALLLAGFMDLLDGTIVFVALPRIADDLGAGFAAMEWVVAGYTLAFALGLITGGRLGDIHGRKRVFLLGVAGFTVTSVAAGLAPTVEILVGARVLQGAFAAVMVPQVLSIAQVIFPPKERFAAFAVFGITISLAALVGPLLGGALTQLDVAGLGWRPIFLINLPVGLLAFVAAAVLVRESRAPDAERLDLVGVGLVTAALLLVMFPLVEGRTLGWPAWTYVAMAASLPTFLLFALWERRTARRGGSPLTPPSLFGIRSFVAGLGLNLVLMSGIGSFWLVVVLWLQVGLGFDPFTTALAGVGWPLAVMVAGVVGAQLAERVGRRLLNVGFALMAAGVVVMLATVRAIGTGIEPVHLLPGLAVAGTGMGLAMPSLFDFILGDVPGRMAGSASGVVNTTMQLGNALGIALVGALFFGLVTAGAGTATDAAAAELRSDLVAAGVTPERAEALASEFVVCFAARADSDDPDVEPTACDPFAESVAGLGPAAADAIDTAARSALAHTFGAAIEQTLWFQVGAFALSALLASLLPRRMAAHEAEPVGEALAEPA